MATCQSPRFGSSSASFSCRFMSTDTPVLGLLMLPSDHLAVAPIKYSVPLPLKKSSEEKREIKKQEGWSRL